MSDIFISYKREDKPRVKRIAEKLEAEGFSVWWDRKIPPGKSFEEVIQEQLDKAACVVVLWSDAAVRSDWVKEEAERGKSRGVLMPILIDKVPIPLGFGRIQTADLTAWQGDAEHPEFQRVLKSLRQMREAANSTCDLVRRLLLSQDPEAVEERPKSSKVRSLSEATIISSGKPAVPATGPAGRPRRRPRFRAAVWAAAMGLISISATAGVYYARPDLLEKIPAAFGRQATGEAGPVATVDLEPSSMADRHVRESESPTAVAGAVGAAGDA